MAETSRLEGELALAIEQLVADRAHAARIFEDHSLQALEIQKARGGGWSPGPKTMGICRSRRKGNERMMSSPVST